MGAPGGARPRFRHLTSAHEVDDSRILRRECASLVRAGHDVAIIAGQPPSEPVEQVPVVGVGACRNRLDRMTRIAWRVLRAAWRERADVCHLHDPELLWVGLLLKLGGCRIVYDVHEDLPKQMMSKTWIPPWARWPLSVVVNATERICAAVFDAVVAATPSIAERFPAAKTVVVQNFPRGPWRVRHRRSRSRSAATPSPTPVGSPRCRASARSWRSPGCCPRSSPA